MGAIENIHTVDQTGSIERWLAEQEQRLQGWQPGELHPLDSPVMKKLFRQLKEWYEQEREKQAPNRYQMAIDQDFYDNIQWDEEDAAELEERGQAPTVYNVVASTVDWIIGTEKRTRVDFKVLPRAEDDVQLADVKTKALKYLSDVNKTSFARSLAFADAVKVGVGWIEDGARGDPTEEPVFSRYENWRNLVWDSSGVERDGSDWRYLYRWKWIDLDIAIAMFPHREAQLRKAAVAANLWGNDEDEDFWYLGQHYQARNAKGEVVGRRSYVNDTALVNNRRARVKLIEGWYRVPERCFICRGDVFDGDVFDRRNPLMAKAATEGVISLFDQLKLRVRVAIMTDGDLLQEMPTPYKHNRFPFTPIWCYLRGRDRMPYGVIRRVRDIQEDLNKRASKSLFLMSVNGIIADLDAIEGTGLSWDDVREEAARPDFLLTKKRGTEMKRENNLAMGEEHLQLMDRDERMIQHSGGVTDDNLGRRTNAISGEAIKARQLQGSIVTAEIFDNERYAIQLQGESLLSLSEQYLSEPKVMRLVGSRGEYDWVKINQPELQPDGSIRWINDITASKADFVVDQQDYHASVRQAMFESMSELVGRISAVNPEAGLRILRMALEFSDLPNKDEMAGEIKKMLGLVDEKDLRNMTPEQKKEHQAQIAARARQQQLQEQAAQLEVQAKAAEVGKLNAETQRLVAEAEELQLRVNDGGITAEERAKLQQQYMDKLDRVEKTATAAVEKAQGMIQQLARENAQLQVKLVNRDKEIDTEAATEREVARINADATTSAAAAQGAETQKAEAEANKRLDAAIKNITGTLEKAVDGLAKQVDEVRAEVATAAKKEPAAAGGAPSVVFEEGAIQVLTGDRSAGKTITADIGGKKVTMRVEPDKPTGAEKKPAKKKD